jgi:hypothetical protein
VNYFLSESIFQRALFSEIMTDGKKRNKESQKDPSNRNQQQSREEHAHRSWVELPSCPSLHVNPSKSRKLLISFFIHFSKLLSLGPCIFNCNYSQNSLNNNTGSNDGEYTLWNDAHFLALRILCKNKTKEKSENK